MNEDYSVLLIPSLSFEDTGNYSCIISNDHGSDSYTASLIVECKYSFKVKCYNPLKNNHLFY